MSSLNIFFNSCKVLFQHVDVDLSIYLTSQNQWKAMKRSIQVKHHPEKILFGEVKSGPKFDGLEKKYKDIKYAMDIFEANYDSYYSNDEIINILQTAYRLRSIFAELDTLDNFSDISLNLTTLNAVIKDATLKREQVNLKKLAEETKLKKLMKKQQREDEILKQQQEEQQAEAKSKILKESKRISQELVAKVVQELFLTHSCNNSTSYEGPNISCCFSDCLNHDISYSTYTILPCCESLLVHDCCLEKFLYDSLTDNDSDDTLLHLHQSSSFDSAKLKCPFCPTLWFGNSAIDTSNNKGFHRSMYNKRNELYFNNVYFQMKNMRANDLIKFESENIIMGNENDLLKRKISKLQEELNLLRQKQLESRRPYLNTPYKDDINTSLLSSIDSNGKTDIDSDDQYINEENNEDYNYDYNYTSDNDKDNSNHQSSNQYNGNDNKTSHEIAIRIPQERDSQIRDTSDNDKDNSNHQISNQYNGNDNKTSHEIAMRILQEVRDNQIRDDQLRSASIKFQPRVMTTLTKGEICLKCTFYPSCQREYIYTPGSDQALTGSKLQRFRSHTCAGYGGKNVNLSIKKKNFLIENESK